MFKLIRHPLTTYLHLDPSKYEEYLINVTQITHADFQPDYPNGYGDTLSHMVINFIDGTQLDFYRTDADEAYKKLNEVWKN